MENAMKWNEEIVISAERATYGVARDFEREVGALVWRGTPRQFWEHFPKLLPDFARYAVESTDGWRGMDDVPLLALHAEFVTAAHARPCEKHYGCQPYEAACAYCAARRRLVAGIVWAAGRLADGSAVSHSSGWPTRCSTYWLSAPAKQGTLAVVDWDQDPGFDRNPRLSEWFTRAEAREQARKDREARRAAQAAYEAARQGAGDVLRAGNGLAWHHGQEGGVVDFGGVLVSARGALAAAGLPRDTIDQWWGLVAEIERREEQMPRLSADYFVRRPGAWTLFSHGAMYTVADGTIYSFGTAAELPRQTRIRDPRAGKCGDRRALRRGARAEIGTWV
jgi:hypothetical protein